MNYTARIIIEGGIDLTVELSDGERAQIILTAYEARDRNLAEKAEREQEQRARSRRERADAYIVDEPFGGGFTSEEILENMHRFSRAFHGVWTVKNATSNPPPPPKPAEAVRPRRPVTVESALNVLEWYSDEATSRAGTDRTKLRAIVRRAKRGAHPDTGSGGITSADFQLVTEAEDILRRAGRI